VPKPTIEIKSYARRFTKQAMDVLVGIMSNPKSPAASRILAANSLIDRGWGKAAQLVAVDGEIRQLVEVKLNVVRSDPPKTIDAVASPSLPNPDSDVSDRALREAK
jgi:hypothetical protein